MIGVVLLIAIGGFIGGDLVTQCIIKKKNKCKEQLNEKPKLKTSVNEMMQNIKNEQLKLDKMENVCDIMTDESINIDERIKEGEKLLEELGIKKPWEGDFREFMRNKNNQLKF